MVSRLNNFSESSCIFFSLTKGYFLSDNRAFIFYLTSMVDVTDCPSSLICIPTSAALSALSESSAVRVNPVEKDTSNSVSLSLLNGLVSSNHFKTSSTAYASHFICVLASSLWTGKCLLTSVLPHPLVDIRQMTKGEHTSFMARKNCFSFCLCSVHLVTWLSSLMSAQCKCHTMCWTTNDLSNGQRGK